MSMLCTPEQEKLILSIREQYRILLKLLKIKTPCSLKLSPDDLSILTANGIPYDLDICLPNKRRRAKECRYAIEALFADLKEASVDLLFVCSYIEKTFSAEKS